MEPDERPDDGGTGLGLRASLAAALKEAIKARDPIAASALRTTLSAISNAEAVDVGTQAGGTRAGASSPHFAGAAAGLGAGEVARRELGAADVRAIVRSEIAEREHAAAGYAASGLSSQAERLRAQASILTAVIAAADLSRSGQKNGDG